MKFKLPPDPCRQLGKQRWSKKAKPLPMYLQLGHEVIRKRYGKQTHKHKQAMLKEFAKPPARDIQVCIGGFLFYSVKR